MSKRVEWQPVLEQAVGIVGEYDTPVTLRQLFYRLIAAGIIPNTQSAYNRLSRLSAQARREGWFPDLLDQTRSIRQSVAFDGSTDALAWLRDIYRRDRTEGQKHSVYLGAEKHGQAAQLEAWFDERGLPVLTLGGWSSQTFVDEARDNIMMSGRPAVLIYAGDFDPSGWYIPQDFVTRVGVFDDTLRIALNEDQIENLGLVENPAPEKSHRDPRAVRFAARFGDVRQVEVEAIDPPVLRQLYADALSRFWDDDAYQAVLQREEADRGGL